MTVVIIAPRIEDALSDVERIVSAGWFRLRPSRTYVAGGQWVQNSWSDSVPFDGSAKEAKLDPLPDNPYELWAEYPDGFGGTVTIREFRTVTDSSSALRWQDLTPSGGPGSTIPTPSNVEARLKALEDALGSVSGGATNLAGITDMTAFTRDLNKATSDSQARSKLGAGTSSLQLGTASGTAADAAAVGVRIGSAEGRLDGHDTALGGKAPKDSPVFTGDARLQSSPASTDNDLSIPTTEWVNARISAATSSSPTGPILLDTTNGAYPARPATTRRVIFCDPSVKPSNDGQKTGGGGMAPGDVWLRGPA